MSTTQSDSEKNIQEKREIENGTQSGSISDRVDNGTDYLEHDLPPVGSTERKALERRLVRKLDCWLLPMVILIYIMNYIDRTNITTARLKGLQQDLHLSNIQYATLVAVFYSTYSPAQMPSNVLLNSISRPSLYIGACVVVWGLISAFTGITKNWGGVLACRILIGLPEAAFYSGAVYLLSRWYTRKELTFRAGFLFSGQLLANAFGSLMAAGILADMEGDRGIRAWRWLFYIEGSMSICVGFLSMWILPNYPHNTSWIVGSQRRLALARLAEDAAEADIDATADDNGSGGVSYWRGVKLALSDPLVILFVLMCLCQHVGLSFVNFFPTLAATLGFNTTITLLLCAPPWIFAVLVTLSLSWHADRTGERFFHIAIPWWITMVGYIIGLSTSSIAPRYVSLFCMASGYAGQAMILAWVSNAIPRPPAKRAAAMGLTNGIGTLGLLIGSYVWDAKWSPGYHPSMIICFCALVVTTVISFGIRTLIIKRNAELLKSSLSALSLEDRLRVEEAAKIEGISMEEAFERRMTFRLLY